MSQHLINTINSFHNYKYDQHTKSVMNLRTSTTADIDEFLEISYILDSNYIKYKMTTNFDIRILGKR